MFLLSKMIIKKDTVFLPKGIVVEEMVLKVKVIALQSFKFNNTWLVFKEDMVEEVMLKTIVIVLQSFKLDLLLSKCM